MSVKAEESEPQVNETYVHEGSVMQLDVFRPTGLTAYHFNHILAGTAMEGLGDAFAGMEANHGVNGLFAIAVANHESAYGKSRLARNNNNLFGMKGRNGWMRFPTKQANVLYFGELMNRSWYKGKSVRAIGKIYCPPNTNHWYNCVNKHYHDALDKLREM